MPPPDTTAAAVRGRLALRFGGGPSGTRLLAAERTPPFHVQRLLFLDSAWPALASAVILNGTAGLFAGDRLEIDISLAEGAAVALTTPSMTRAFAMPAGEAEVCTRITVAAGCYAEYLPAPLLLCEDACVRQRLDATVVAGGTLVLGEVVAFGRVASGELHAYRAYEQRVEIAQAGNTVLAERLYLLPQEARAPGLIGSFGAYGSLNIVTDECDLGALVAGVRDILAEERLVLAGASRLHGNAGLAVRVLAAAPSAAHAALAAVAVYMRRYHVSRA